MTEDLVKRLREALVTWDNAEITLGSIENKRAENMLRSISNSRALLARIESLERELAEAKRLESAACKRLAEYNRDLQTAEQALAAALKRLAEVAEIAEMKADHAVTWGQAAVAFRERLQRVATIASNNPNG